MLAPSGGGLILYQAYGSQDDISSGSAAYPTKHFVSSFVTLTPEHECHDKSGLTQGHFSNETGVFSSTLDDGSLVDDFLESQTIDSAIAQDIYVPHWDVTNDAHIDDPVMCKNLIDHVPPPGKQREAADVCEICMRVFELKAAAAAKSEEIAGLNVQIVEQLGKVRLTWMIGHSLRLVVMKCGQSTEYRAALGKAISMAINKGSHGDKDSTSELRKLQLILLSDALAASHARGEKRKKGASSSLEMGGPFVVMPSVSSQDTSLVAADYHISILAIIDGTVSTTEPR
ncbi:hypothetical protein Tco_0717046 [Tanacetum coccineum]